jgi:SRSO17 transposase
MKRRELERLDEELRTYLESMVEGLGRVERRAAMQWYATGLLLDGDRKSFQPMAARLVDAESEAESMRQRMQEAVCVAQWSDGEVLGRLARKVDTELPGIEALVIDDTGFPKKGKHSVGVMRQYSGTLGRVENCQVAVSLHLAAEAASCCIDMRLYLPAEWVEDSARRRKAGVPDTVAFQTKWQIALDQLDAALRAGVRRHVVLADAGYGDVTAFRDGLDTRELPYLVAINGSPAVWPPQSDPRIPPRTTGKTRGQTPTRYRDDEYPPLPVGELAPEMKYRKVSWREGSRGRQSSRFAAVRIRTAQRHTHSRPPGSEQWLLCEWVYGEPKPTRFWLSTLPPTSTIRTLVRLAKLRWRVERDYQEMKQEIGLDHFEGRMWRGFHHHVTLCAVAHAFLALRRALFPPEDQLDAA